MLFTSESRIALFLGYLYYGITVRAFEREIHPPQVETRDAEASISNALKVARDGIVNSSRYVHLLWKSSPLHFSLGQALCTQSEQISTR